MVGCQEEVPALLAPAEASERQELALARRVVAQARRALAAESPERELVPRVAGLVLGEAGFLPSFRQL